MRLASRGLPAMNDTNHEPDKTDAEMLTYDMTDEELEAAADQTKPMLWTQFTTSCGTNPYC
jgi:hypothetical protein